MTKKYLWLAIVLALITTVSLLSTATASPLAQGECIYLPVIPNAGAVSSIAESTGGRSDIDPGDCSPSGQATATATNTAVPTHTPTATATATPSATPTGTATATPSPTSTPTVQFSVLNASCDATFHTASLDYTIQRNGEIALAAHTVIVKRNGATVYQNSRLQAGQVSVAGEHGDIVIFEIWQNGALVASDTVVMADCLAAPPTGVPPTPTFTPTATATPVDYASLWSGTLVCQDAGAYNPYSTYYMARANFSYAGLNGNQAVRFKLTWSIDDSEDFETDITVSDGDSIETALYYAPEGSKINWIIYQWVNDSWIPVLSGAGVNDAQKINCIPSVEDVEYACDASSYLANGYVTSTYTTTLDGAHTVDVTAYVADFLPPASNEPASEVFTQTALGPVFTTVITSGHMAIPSYEVFHKGYPVAALGFNQANCFQNYALDIAQVDGGNNRLGYGVVVTGTEVISTAAEIHNVVIVGEFAGMLGSIANTLIPTSTYTYTGLQDGEHVTATVYSLVDGRMIDQVFWTVELPDTLLCQNEPATSGAQGSIYWNSSVSNVISGTFTLPTITRQVGITQTVPYSATGGAILVCYPAIPSEEPATARVRINPTLALDGIDTHVQVTVTVPPGLNWIHFGDNGWHDAIAITQTGALLAVNDPDTSLRLLQDDTPVNDLEVGYGPDVASGVAENGQGDMLGWIEGVTPSNDDLFNVGSALCGPSGAQVEASFPVTFYGVLGQTATLYVSYGAVVNQASTIGIGAHSFTHVALFPSGTGSVTWRFEMAGQVVASGVTSCAS